MRLNPLFKILILYIIFFQSKELSAQRFLADYDSTFFMADTLRTFLKRMENLHFSGYIQPQFQVAENKGINSFSGGNFQNFSDNRFMLRRARLKIDYRMQGKNGSFPSAVFTFQFEATERDVNVRDMFVRIFEPKKHHLSITAGLFARPFGYEVNLSSSFRETPERGRMSQILMPSERDLGAMVSYESQAEKRKNPLFKFDVGVFNGQGKSGPAEFDSYKDVISRLTLKPVSVSNKTMLSTGVSFLYGGWVQATRYKYEMTESGGKHFFLVDSNTSNIGDRAPRNYYGADIQLIRKHSWGKTEFRGEYWMGKQAGTASTTLNPGELPEEPTYIRDFDGGFFYFLQNLFNEKWELMAKYDWYDPNRKVSRMDIGMSGTNLTIADIEYRTYGIGLTRYFTENLKLSGYYEFIRNETTALNGYTSDLKDNVFTLRVQMRF